MTSTIGTKKSLILSPKFFDSWAIAEFVKSIDINKNIMRFIYSLIDIISLVVFLNNHKSFKKLNIETLVKKMKKPAIVIDTWNQIEKSKFDKFQNVRYSGLGND